MTSWSIPRESVELVGPITVTADGVPVTAFELAVLARNVRPTPATWAAPTVAEDSRYVLVGPGTSLPLDPGAYAIWCRYTSAPEIPVFSVGLIIVT